MISVVNTLVSRKSNSVMKHQFGLMTLSSDGRVTWACHFTANKDRVHDALKSIECDTGDHTSVDLAAILDGVAAKLQTQQNLHLDELTRCIFTFGRSKYVPLISSSPQLVSDPLFYLDVVYIHDKSNSETLQSTYEVLHDLISTADGRNNFLFETHPSNMRLHGILPLLLAHAMQREVQENITEKLSATPLSLCES